jgi:hypothetical protein
VAVSEPEQPMTEDGPDPTLPAPEDMPEDEREPLVEAEPLPAPAATGIGATGTTTVTPAPGSESDAMRAPDEALDYVTRAQHALVQAIGTGPVRITLTETIFDALTMLVLVRGDRTTASDVHDMRSIFDPEVAGTTVVPFDALDPREQGGLDVIALAVQRAGRFMGRDGS